MRVYHPWIHEACHWPKEDPWRYFYNSSRLNEPVRVVVEWLVGHKATSLYREATTTTAKSTKPASNKGKRNIFDNTEGEKSYKFKKDPLVEISNLEIEENK